MSLTNTVTRLIFFPKRTEKNISSRQRIPLQKKKPIKENLPCSIRWISRAERLLSQQMNLTTQQVQSDILALQDFWNLTVWKIKAIAVERISLMRSDRVKHGMIYTEVGLIEKVT